jgi:hypothetical protein
MSRVVWPGTLCLCLAVVANGSACAGPEVKGDKAPDSKEIDRLVGRLGSPDFAEREEAQKALRRIGYPALTRLRAAVKSPDGEVRRRAGTLVQEIENGIDSLLALYRDYGLPLPPEDAKLVWFEGGGGGRVNGKLDPKWYTLGFLLKPAGKRTDARLLRGASVWKRGNDCRIIVLEPARLSASDIDSLLRDDSLDIDYYGGMPTAIQCKSRGWDLLAEQLFRHSLAASPQGGPPRLELCEIAWEYWQDQLTQAGTDRRAISRHLRRLMEDDASLANEGNRRLLKSLDAALVPSRSEPGSVAALIDRLIDVRKPALPPDALLPDPVYEEVVGRGFDVVPQLIEHWDDDRLTRWRGRRVGDVARSLLRGLAGEALGEDKAAAEAWWDEARRVGEEAYLLAHIFPKDEMFTSLNDHVVWVLGKKYPASLAKVYREILDRRPRYDSWQAAKVIGLSGLSREAKRELFLYGARHENLEHRQAAFWELRKVNPTRFATLLTETLDSLSGKPAEPYWECREASFALLVRQTDDELAWKALGRLARRADVGLRIEILERICRRLDEPSPTERQVRFLADFLGDSAVRDAGDEAGMFDGPYAGWGFTRLEVRNFAAIELAQMLDLAVELPRDRFQEQDPVPWTEPQWAKLRREVREAVQRRFAKGGGKPAAD